MSASTTTLREYLLIVQEPQPRAPIHATCTLAEDFVAQTGVPLVPPVLSPIDQSSQPYNCLFIRIDGGNAFSMRPKPVTQDIMMGGGLATIGQTVSGYTALAGNLQTKLYASQAPFLLGWACTPINSARTAPWTTLAPTAGGLGGTVIGNLATASLYHAIRKSDGSYKTRAYLGVTVTGGTLACDANSQIATLNLNLQGMEPVGNTHPTFSTNPSGGTFAWGTDPAQVDGATLSDPGKIPDPLFFPYDPVMFVHSGKQLDIYPTTDSAPSTLYRTQYSSISLNFGNKVDVRWFENRWATMARLLGRQSTLSATILYKPTGASGTSLTHSDRDSFESLAGQTMKFGFSTGNTVANSINTITFTFNTQNVIRDLEDDTPVDRVYEQRIVVQNIWDSTLGTPTDYSVACSHV